MWSWNFFTFLFCGIITHILTAFSIIFLTQFVKKGLSLPGLSSKFFTFDHLFGHRSGLAIFLGLNGQKTINIDAWAEAKTESLLQATGHVTLHFSTVKYNLVLGCFPEIFDSGFVLLTLLFLKAGYNHSKSKLHRNDPTDNNPTNCCLRNNKQVRKVGFYKSLP